MLYNIAASSIYSLKKEEGGGGGGGRGGRKLKLHEGQVAEGLF